jgi:phosphonoacetaldehyde dehydrogenase
MKHEFGSIIGGEQVTSGSWITVRNPYTTEVVGRVAAVDRDEAARVLEKSRVARFTLTRRERCDILNRMADRLEADGPAVSRMITDESGLCIQDTTYEVSRAADVLRFSAIKALDDDSEVFPCDITKNGRPRRIYTMRQPLNLIAAITPFNHPLNQVVHKIAPAIATNNAMVLKPAAQTPLAAYWVAQIALDCGLPADMVNVISGESIDVAEAIVTSNLVEMITFTGSTAVGRRIAAIAGYKRLVLEMGGSSPLIVLDDADVQQAVAITIAGLFKNSGQRCTAIRRLLVHDSLADEFAQLLAEQVGRISCGDPYNPDTMMGTIISEAAAKQIEQRVEQTIEQGAKLLAGHRRKGALYPPTVLDFVRNEHPVTSCETFGPVAPIIRIKSLDQAIKVANDTEFGLSAGVLSNHWPSIQRVISSLETGTVNVNEAPSYRLEWSPFGGIKSSGLGYKEGVIDAMKSMTNVKTYSLPWDAP